MRANAHQIDDPDLPDGWQMYPEMSVQEYHKYAQVRIEALNHGLKGLPEDRIRFHPTADPLRRRRLEARKGYVRREAAAVGRTKPEGSRLMDAVVERGNMWLAYQRVVKNKGAPGVDGLTVAEFKDWLKVSWPSVKVALLEGRYIPQAVRAVDIPKAGGGVRTLGIPTVGDRLIQQALLQVMQPIFEPGFSESSYGFRPGRSAQQAVQAAQAYVREGRRWVVDIDLEKFFDRVNHDILMSRLARRIEDERVLKLIRRFLEAGIMRGGLVSPRVEGTPQGGPLSPLLANLLLDDLDKELEKRRAGWKPRGESFGSPQNSRKMRRDSSFNGNSRPASFSP